MRLTSQSFNKQEYEIVTHNTILNMIKILQWVFAVTLFCGTTMFSACSKDDSSIVENDVTAIADKVWTFSQTHPDGFTIDIRTMTEPTTGIAVSYAATQNSHSRDQLDKVVSHALQHDGYVGGWLNSENGLYYFDSTCIFPEDQLDEAVLFGKENGQYSVFILSTFTEVVIDEYLEKNTQN